VLCHQFLIGIPKLFINLDQSLPIKALERERPRIVNNFAASASSDYEYQFRSHQRISPDFQVG